MTVPLDRLTDTPTGTTSQDEPLRYYIAVEFNPRIRRLLQSSDGPSLDATIKKRLAELMQNLGAREVMISNSGDAQFAAMMVAQGLLGSVDRGTITLEQAKAIFDGSPA